MVVFLAVPNCLATSAMQMETLMIGQIIELLMVLVSLEFQNMIDAVLDRAVSVTEIVTNMVATAMVGGPRVEVYGFLVESLSPDFGQIFNRGRVPLASFLASGTDVQFSCASRSV